MPPAVSMPQAQADLCREGNAGQWGRSPPLPCGTFLRLGENRLGKRQGQNKYYGSFRAFRHLPSSLADDNARKRKYMHGATAVNVILSLKCKEAHSRKKPGIALDAAGSA